MSNQPKEARLLKSFFNIALRHRTGNLNKKMCLVEAKKQRKHHPVSILTNDNKSYQKCWARYKTHMCEKHVAQVSPSTTDCDLV